MVSLIGRKVKYNGIKYTVTDYFNCTDLIMLDDEITVSRIHCGIEWLNYNKMKNEAENIDKPQGNGVLPCVSESCIQFAIWVQDNYSQNKYVNTHEMLPKGKMRKDFTNDIYTMDEIWQHYNSR